MAEIKYLSNLHNSSTMVGRFIKHLKNAGLALIIFIPVVIINFFQMASMVLLPISPKLVRAINRFFANYYWAYLVLLLKLIGGITVDILGDEIPAEENALVDCNHQNIADIPVIMVLAWSKKRLGDMKFFVKDVVKYIPGPGWGMIFLDCIFVKRNWESDKSRIDSIFGKFKKHNIPLWLVSFLEGTRITPEKLKKSQQYMQDKGLPLTRRVMAPRTKGFVASAMALREQLDAVYNITLFYPSGIPSLWQLISGDVERVVMYVKRTPIADLPEKESDIERWIIDRYVEKDQFLAAAETYNRSNPLGAWSNKSLASFNLPFLVG